MYTLYSVTKQLSIQAETRCVNIRIDSSGLKKGGVLFVLFWNAVTLGKAKLYSVYDENNSIIHTSYVMTRNIKFPFMRKGFNDIEIGPCWTDKSWRGKGIYPYVLYQIVQNELQDPDYAFMIIDSENASSIRGATKAGFRKICELRKDRLGRYVTN